MSALDSNDTSDPPRPLEVTAQIGTVERAVTVGSTTKDATPWYATPAFFVLSLLLCGPFGLALMWTRGIWSSRTKLLVTAAWSAIALVGLGSWVQSNVSAIIGTVERQSAPPIGSPSPAAGAGLAASAPVLLTPSPASLGPIAAQPQATMKPAIPADVPIPATLQSPAAGTAPASGLPPLPILRPTGAPAPSPAPVTSQVRVANTGGQGANLRERPNEAADRVKNLAEGTLLEVVGPGQATAGRVWLNVRDPAGAVGWVVADFLEPTR